MVLLCMTVGSGVLGNDSKTLLKISNHHHGITLYEPCVLVAPMRCGISRRKLAIVKTEYVMHIFNLTVAGAFGLPLLAEGVAAPSR